MHRRAERVNTSLMVGEWVWYKAASGNIHSCREYYADIERVMGDTLMIRWYHVTTNALFNLKYAFFIPNNGLKLNKEALSRYGKLTRESVHAWNLMILR